MNERIKELAEQAGCKVMDDGDWYIPSATGIEKIVYTKGIGLEKFAELIVRECIQFRTVLTQFDGTTPYGDGYENGLRDMAEVIAEHFGVEE